MNSKNILGPIKKPGHGAPNGYDPRLSFAKKFEF